MSDQETENDDGDNEGHPRGAGILDIQTLPETNELRATCKSQYEETLSKQLSCVELDVSFWAGLLKEKLGIESFQAFQDVGCQIYPFLLQFVRYPKERKALKRLLHVHVGELFKKDAFFNEWLPLLEAQVETMKRFQKEERCRSEHEVQKVEDWFRKMLIVPESAWISTEASLSDANYIMKHIFVNIRNAVSDVSNLDKKSFIAEKVCGFHLKGIWTTDNPCDVSVRKDALSLPEDIVIDFPLRSQFSEQLQFESKKNEGKFLEHLKIFGCSLLNEQCSSFMLESRDNDEGYCSTVKYCFIPMASCVLQSHQLLLSEDALIHLRRIEKALESDATVAEKEFKLFLNRFGSHALSGPVHYGGLFIWKCYTIDYEQSEKHEIYQLQKDVIRVSATMHFPIEERVSAMEGSLTSYPENIRDQTYIQTFVIGGPSTVVGFPGWKYCLNKCNRMWQLIDHGLSQIAVWDIISMNHKKDFKMSQCLAKEMKQHWVKQKGITNKDQMPSSVIVTTVGTTLDVLHCEDFNSLFHHFRNALETYNAECDGIIHPHKANKVTSNIEKTVSLLRAHFHNTEQLMADCLLLTILNPLEYRPEKGRFSASLTRSDINYLCEKSVGLHEEFLMVQRQNSLLKVQSYFFYLTIFLCDLLGAEEECIKCHIEYLKNKLSPLISEISSCLESLHINSNFGGFQSKMELFYKEDVFVHDRKFLQSPVTVEKYLQSQSMDQSIMELFTNLGLTEYFPQKLSLHHALELRDDIILYEKPNIDLKIYPFIMLQKIMMFDPNCRIGFPDDFDDSDECDNFPKIHPMDGLLSLLHCSDNFLRQVLLSRLATCNIAVPLLLPHPITKEPTLLLWALRSIVNKYLSRTPSDRIVNFPTAFVSFIKIGNPSMSKSEILNSVLNTDRSFNRDIFLSSNSPGVNTSSVMVKGLVEVCWYLSLESVGFPTAIAFVNLHGDGCDTDCEKQIKFLCEICTMHIVLLDEDVFEDAKRECTLELLQSVSNAKLGVPVIILHKDNSEQIEIHLKEFKSEYIFIKYDRNVHNLGQRILKRVKKRLKESSFHLPLANATKLAHKCLINTDEDGQDCTWGSELAEKVHSMISNEVIPSEILCLWHEWAKEDKKQHRETTKVLEHCKQENLQMLRHKQFNLAETNTSVAKFLEILNTELRNRQATWYFMLHLKMKLDDLSKLKHPYYKVEKELNTPNSYEQKDGLKTELKSGDHHQLGIEYFLKEIGQIYEAFLEQKYSSMPSINDHKFNCLPRIAAQLLFEGFPIEIYDGDASHVPQKWISAILNSLSEIINISNSKIFTLSVLGVQSTGKSTLLNTLFGTQFRVRAGRCTRGAFMQLIPVHKSIWMKVSVHYILIIDTEGLRTPECKRSDNIHEHDNELATFVIGMADLTLITVHGEPLGEMQDILLTAAHAFLRMDLVQLKPSCYIIHQNVQQEAAKNLIQGRAQTNKHLDTGAKIAVRETGRVTEYANFSDVIAYNYMEDVASFPSLWNGTPAQVSSEYSKQAQSLKQDLITKHITKVCGSSIVNIKARLEGLWKSILQEDFVFNFKNSFEIDVYKRVDAQYGDWSWGFKKEMIEWEKNAHYKLMSCTEEELEHVIRELTKSLHDDVENLYIKYKTLINGFFNANKMMLKWQPSTNLRLEVLCDELQMNAGMHFRQLHQVRQDCVVVEKRKEKISKCILKRVQHLVNTLEKKLHDNEVIQIFEESWNVWLHELTDEIKCCPIPDIPFEVKKCLTEYFRADRRVLHQKLENRNLAEWNELELRVVDYHCHCLLDPQSDLRSELQEHTNQTLKVVDEHLNNLYKKCASNQDFRSQFVSELLDLLKDSKKIDSESHFTSEYHVDIALTVCGYAIPFFTEIAKRFRKRHDPHEYIEHEIKPCLQRLFINKYNEVDNEKNSYRNSL